MTNEDMAHAILNILIDGVEPETKVKSILQLFNQYQGNGVIIGWLETRVRPPDLNSYVDIRTPDGTIRHERLVTDKLMRDMRQNNYLYKPSFQ